MKAVAAILIGLFVCGVLAQSLDAYLPARWGTIVGAIAGCAVGTVFYRWRLSR